MRSHGFLDFGFLGGQLLRALGPKVRQNKPYNGRPTMKKSNHNRSCGTNQEVNISGNSDNFVIKSLSSTQKYCAIHAFQVQ